VELQLQSRRTLGVSELLAVERPPHPARAYLVLPDTVVRNGRACMGHPYAERVLPGLRQVSDWEHMREKEHRMRVV
jgi:hypothetical protein